MPNTDVAVPHSLSHTLNTGIAAATQRRGCGADPTELVGLRTMKQARGTRLAGMGLGGRGSRPGLVSIGTGHAR